MHAVAGIQPPRRVTSAEDSHGVGTPSAYAVVQRAMKFFGSNWKKELDAVLKKQREETTPG